MTINYLNLFRAVNCIEQKLSDQATCEDEEDDDATQAYSDF